MRGTGRVGEVRVPVLEGCRVAEGPLGGSSERIEGSGAGSLHARAVGSQETEEAGPGGAEGPGVEQWGREAEEQRRAESRGSELTGEGGKERWHMRWH